MSSPVCPRCHKPAQVADTAFCAYCGAPMRAMQQSSMPDEAREMLRQAEKTKDPVEKRRLLLQAQEQFPDCLEIAEAILFLGRLYERNPRKLDFSVIKCYLWHMYLTPREFSEEQKSAMRTELFEHPDLLRCQQLSTDADLFTRLYLEKLGREFVNLFLKSSNHYTRTMFGFRLDNRMSRVLAEPAAQMMYAIHTDTQLDGDRRDLLYDALYRAFLSETGGESRYVDEKLAAAHLPIPARL